MRKILNIKWKGLLALSIVLLLAAVSRGQNITVSSAQGQNINTFVQNNLVGGGVIVSNVKFNNANGNITTPQIGTFDANGYTLLRMTSGVLMTTGNISVAPGPNNSGSNSMAELYNADGQMALNAYGTDRLKLDTSKLSTGIYTLRVSTTTVLYSRKVIIE